MSGTDKDERCHCPRDGDTCPHCGRGGNADHRARCHRAAVGDLKSARAVEDRHAGDSRFGAGSRARRLEAQSRLSR